MKKSREYSRARIRYTKSRKGKIVIFVKFVRSVRWWWIASLFFMFLWMESGCQYPTSPEPTDAQKQAIINGKGDLSQPAIGAFVVQRGRSFCTATLITRQLLVTAAHCIDAVQRYGMRNIQFRTDFPNPNGTYRSEYHEFQEMKKHPRYRAGSGATYDIAVVVLKKKVTNVTPIQINTSAMQKAWIGTNVHVVGYGLIQTQPNNRSADKKYAADIPLFQIDPYSFIHYDNNTPKPQRKSACHGDSGGPALYTVAGQTRVMGVTSIAYRATPAGNGRQTLCDGGAVSTRTDSHMDFLRPYLQKYGDGPIACQTDAECGACGVCSSAKKRCEPKPVPSEPKSCKPCRADADCGAGLCFRFDTGFRCVQPCTQDSCCPTGSSCGTFQGMQGSKTVCMPTQTQCPDSPCKTDKECGIGEVCTNNTCTLKLPPRSPELCLPCTSHKTCGQGLCKGPAGNGRCSQPCGTGDFCPKGFVCQGSQPGLPKQCVPKNGACTIPCIQDAHCPSGFECKNKVCFRKGGGDHGDSCDPAPCKQGLQCVGTSTGKVCLQPCGVKPGFGGQACLSGNKCEGGARCFRNSSFRVCVASCGADGSCKANGGGRCSSLGNCLCSSDGDCENGFVCNIFTGGQGGPVGACVPKAARLGCPAQFQCSRFSSGEFCTRALEGTRTMGESCDGLNTCKKGLTCVPTASGGICFEDCTQTQRCSLGGRCFRVTRTASICLCQGDAQCPTGRACEVALQGYGYCKPKGKTEDSGCLDNRECPTDYVCSSKKCTPGTTQPNEPNPAEPPTSEPPVTSDAGVQEALPEPTGEKAVDPTPEKNQAVEKSVDKTPTTPKPDKPIVPVPSGGCGCQQGQSPTPSMPWTILLGLVLLWGVRRRKRA